MGLKDAPLGGGGLMARKRDTIQPETVETQHGLWVAHHTPLRRSLYVCLM